MSSIDAHTDTATDPNRLLDADGGLPQARPPWPPRDSLRITSVRAVVTAPEGAPLVVVRVDTSEPGLYGLGCATFTQRYAAVAAAVDEHVGPLAVGRHPADIEDITRLIHYSSYWRNGPVLNNALSGVDQALWDIAGKRAGLPVYELLGGRSRAAVEVYSHAAGHSVEETLDQAEQLVAAGYRNVRLQTGQPGLGAYGAPGTPGGYPRSPHPDGWDPERYLRTTPALFAAARERFGPELNLMHDVHSRLTPKQAVVLARALEPYGLSFLEDVIAPEYYDRLPEVRAASPVPIAVGEQLGSVPDAVRLIRDGGVDLLRLHTSSVGGLTPTRKLVALCELLGVRTAFHSPGDISPVGVAANLAVDVNTPAFGFQESHEYNNATHEVFPGTPVVREGYLYPSQQPGWGVELDEKAAAAHPPTKFLHERWSARVRRPDGALEAP
ncbi:enolase C-terminal domain-like protein [Actinacidiphila oryziradicis]|uniref:Starvation-sensing protein RspA n=1 Tax=Actinacidiphila oryziradicis TaxID=2571141 RepID=A0A4U0SQ26_9ACTN|nr:enolase C-terminal domain-like protein [Actinacidiphila oryziradicis]TKA10311.1 starvation-sensing protein RspA [Actinacidiphila oryziradicis]